jgi:hypothetical protein
MGDKKRKLLLTLLIVGVLGSIAAFGTYSAFTATTTNSGNSFAAGTVAIQDENGAATALFNNITNQAPSTSTSKCIRIKYTGSLASKVHFYGPSTANGDKFQIQVERGSGLTDLATRGSCAGFSSSSTAFTTADLTGFPTAYTGGVVGKASDASWAQDDTVDYRFTLSVKDDSTANAHTSAISTGSFAITWEAQST